MTAAWKIFRVANLLQAVLFSALIGIGMYVNPTPVNTLQDLFVLLFICAVPLLVVLNCIHNILLTHYLLQQKKISAIRSFFFWSLLVLFLLILLLPSYGIFTVYERFSKLRTPKDFLNSGLIAVLVCLFLLVVNGIYIIVAQMVLLGRIKKKYKEAGLEMLKEIGSEEESAI